MEINHVYFIAVSKSETKNPIDKHVSVHWYRNEQEPMLCAKTVKGNVPR